MESSNSIYLHEKVWSHVFLKYRQGRHLAVARWTTCWLSGLVSSWAGNSSDRPIRTSRTADRSWAVRSNTAHWKDCALRPSVISNFNFRIKLSLKCVLCDSRISLVFTWTREHAALRKPQGEWSDSNRLPSRGLIGFRFAFHLTAEYHHVQSGHGQTSQGIRHSTQQETAKMAVVHHRLQFRRSDQRQRSGHCGGHPLFAHPTFSTG